MEVNQLAACHAHAPPACSLRRMGDNLIGCLHFQMTRGQVRRGRSSLLKPAATRTRVGAAGIVWVG